MPYRRLPNTDNARIRALKIAIEKCSSTDFKNIAVSMKTLHEAKAVVGKFEKLCQSYKRTFEVQVKANRIFQTQAKNARIYISHFLQVLYMCIIREEIKLENLNLYNLQDYKLYLPDLATNEMLLEWGEEIIEGEEKRILSGGVPIYNPSIAKVKVIHEVFKNGYLTQQIHQNSTARIQNDIANYRKQVDEVILRLWDEIETSNINLSVVEKIKLNKEYGIIYYYRKGEVIG